MGFSPFFCDVKNSHFCCCPNLTGDTMYFCKNAFFAFIGYPSWKDILFNAHN